MADAIRVRICAQTPRLFLVDKLDEKGAKHELLTLTDDEIGAARDALDTAAVEPESDRMIYVVASRGKPVIVDRGGEKPACACLQHDARGCLVARYSAATGKPFTCGPDEKCECICHVEERQDERDEEDARS